MRHLLLSTVVLFSVVLTGFRTTLTDQITSHLQGGGMLYGYNLFRGIEAPISDSTVPYKSVAAWSPHQVPATALQTAVAGDCNDDGGINAGDITAVFAEISDGDGNSVLNVGGGTYPGTAGCDANTDAVIDASDLTCTGRLLFGLTCDEPGTYTTPSSLALTQVTASAGMTVTMPITLQSNGNTLGSSSFSIDFDQSCLTVDSSSAIHTHIDPSILSAVTLDLGDTDSEIDMIISSAFALNTAIPDGVIATIDFTVTCTPSPGNPIMAPVIFAADLPTSIGVTTGSAVPVTTVNGAVEIAAPTPQLPSLVIPNDLTAQVNTTVTVPVAFQSGGADVTNVIFLLDYDETCLNFDPADNNADNVPDSVSFFLPENFDVDVYLGAVETEGAVGIVIYDSQAPYTQLPDLNPLVAIEFSVICNPGSGSQIAPVRFSDDPSPAFGSSNGSSVLGTATDGAVTILGTALPITLPTDATAAPNSQVTIPVIVPESVDGLEIIAYSFQLNFDPAVLSLPANATDAYDTAGTLSDGWTVTANTDNPGELRLAGFHVAPLSGSGTLLNLAFDVVGPANSSTALTWSDFLFNEGVPGVETTDGFLTVVSWALAGQVFYQEEANRAISGVTLDLSGATTAQTATDAEGYSFTIEATGAHTVAPSYAGPANGISAFDAAYIAQCVAGLRNSADCPILAADTSGNSSLSAFDAALIAQYAAGLAGPTSRVGTWVFAPASRTYADLTGDLPAENFGAYLVGEVTGNWSPPAAAAAQAPDAPQKPAPLAIVADGTQAALQLSQSHSELLAFQATVQYDVGVGSFIEAVPTRALGAGWELVTNEVEPGVIVLVGYGVTPVAGAGELVTLHFQAHEAGNQVTSTVIQAQLNEEPLWVGQTAPAHQQFLPLVVN